MAGDDLKDANQRGGRSCEIFLRLLALVFTLVAAIVLAVDKQNKVVSIQLAPTLPPLTVPVTAKSSYSSAFVYFVVSNAVACAYAAVSLLLSFACKSDKNSFSLMFVVADTVMVALLHSGVGATAAVGMIGYQGNSHLRWQKVCNVVGKFCDKVAVSLVISLVGSLAFLLLVVVSGRRRH